ncbi:MAG: glycosyltransferase family 39 protein [Solirubrobacteraceae bacterium]
MPVSDARTRDARGCETRSSLTERRWFVPTVLATPFVIAVVALRGLTVALPIFHGSDERVYQLPTILQFGAQLPFPDLGHYPAAQTPLLHLLLAYAGQLIGYEPWRLRLIEVVISYGLALAVFALLHRRLALARLPGLILSLLFVLSPYVFGSSFRVITDNLATLLVVIAIERLERYRETGRLGPFAVACASIAAAMLTRQSTAFMLAVAGLYALRGGTTARPPAPAFEAARARAPARAHETARARAPARARETARARGAALMLVGLAALPAGALFLTWHGLVPPGADPSSCGLCPAGRASSPAGASGLEVQTAELTLATIGLYGAILFAPLRSPRVDRGALAAAAAAALLLLIWPATPGTHAAGLLWNAARRLPAIDGTPLLFWVLVPLAGVVLRGRIRAASQPFRAVAFLSCFLLAALAIRYPWQKYVDPFALLGLLLTVRRDELSTPRELAGAAALALGFLAYTLSFVV